MIIASIKDNIVDSLIVGHGDVITLDVAKSMIPDETLVEITEYTGFAMVGSEYVPGANKFVPLPPYSGWTFDKDTWTHIPPKEYPANSNGEKYIWSEEHNDWIKFDLVNKILDEIVAA